MFHNRFITFCWIKSLHKIIWNYPKSGTLIFNFSKCELVFFVIVAIEIKKIDTQVMCVCACVCCRYMDKRLSLKLNGGRIIEGVLRGFDPFMNLVVDETVERCKNGQQNVVGMVVSSS